MTDLGPWLRRFQARHPRLSTGLPPDLAPLPQVLEREAAQAEHLLSLAEYMARVVPPGRVARGQVMALRHRALLARIEARFGVAAEYIVAIWGVESDFGARRGDVPVLAALATLAAAGRRPALFEAELAAALELIARGWAGPEMRGSWAGAIGHGQFLPSSVIAHGVDFDGDGRVDTCADDPADALASIASYLVAHGWQAGLGWGREVTGTAASETGRDLLMPAGITGPAFAVTDNFRVLLRYNNAVAYALAVGLLADLLAGRARRTRWPHTRPLSRAQMRALQRALARAGHDPGAADGLMGPDTARAIRACQRALGLAVDGHASADLLARLASARQGTRPATS